MRDDMYLKAVLRKCEALKESGLWLPEPDIRPKAWLENFEDSDKGIASLLLDRFIFYRDRYTRALLKSSYNSLFDYCHGSKLDSFHEIIDEAKFTLVTGENPSPTDSGNLICRMMRQHILKDDKNIVSPVDALVHADSGGTIIFLDDFIGTGNQFHDMWHRELREEEPKSFNSMSYQRDFTSIYMTLVALESGVEKIKCSARKVIINACHYLGQESTLSGINLMNYSLKNVDDFLEKYVDRLTPREDCIARNRHFKKYGLDGLGALFGFEHSIPDSTLPIFWSPGDMNWKPLIERA